MGARDRARGRTDVSVRRHIRRAALLGLPLLLAFLAWDVHLPSAIAWTPAADHGEGALRADGLVLHTGDDDIVWATRGYGIYRSVAGAPFERLWVLRTPPGEAWAGYSRTVRHLFGYQELTELIPRADGSLVAFAGGRVYRVALDAGGQREVHRMRFYGRGEGRGVMPHGLTEDGGGRLYYGEYPRHEESMKLGRRLYRSDDGGRSWHVAYEFPPGQIRHIHSVQWDPIGDSIWVTTGDDDEQPRIGYSRDHGESFTWIAQGEQRFRACSLLFQEDRVAWIPDTHRGFHAQWWEREGGRIVESSTVFDRPGHYARPLDRHRGLVTIGHLEPSLWLVGAPGGVSRLAAWEPAPPLLRGPYPNVRVARSAQPAAGVVHVNPLRTTAGDAFILRLPVPHLLSADGAR